MLEFDLRWQRGDFSLRAQGRLDGGVIGLCGPSGAGKSTLLAMIAGLQRPDAGAVRWNGVALVETGRRVFLPPEKRRIGLVFQDGCLFPHLTVQNNLLYGYRRRPASERLFPPDAIITLLDIGHLLTRRPRDLSGGEKQRVALGRALLYSPSLLLLDEPLASLDNHRKQQILPFLLRVRDTLGLPMLYVSHAEDEVRYLTDRVWHMEAGRLHTGPAGERIGP
ncbi:ABC transporter-like protein [Isoalcanivorax pacificus W11-5]|uniref:ABC transporter-like protein n=1 Tax=Isoalcanivorax pacificus W11-5 TaxID=391936 RepID=A0A0B4XHI0_9GAMM|nr:ATP-binding cassette domain-containing protein [Isoalcanivorax pacificus]AJD46511.1 ABC transporter-like protein [Isoalcanivorax pacificus W11-5]